MISNKGPFHQDFYREQGVAIGIGSTIYCFDGENTHKKIPAIQVHVLRTTKLPLEWKTLPIKPTKEAPSHQSWFTGGVYNYYVYLLVEVVQYPTSLTPADNASIVYRFDVIRYKWEKPQVIGTIPYPRRYYSAAVVRDKMYIFGGHGPDY